MPKITIKDLVKFTDAKQVCHDCGMKYGKRIPGIHGIRGGKCDMCGKEGSVTAPRDYGYARTLHSTKPHATTRETE